MKSKYKGSISTKHFQIYDADSFETKMVIGFDEAYAKLSSHAALVSALETLLGEWNSTCDLHGWDRNHLAGHDLAVYALKLAKES